MLTFLARNWFLLALIGLFIAVVPGVVLVILAALSLDPPVNAWLMDHFQITYRLAMSPWLVYLLLLVPPAIVLLYFLKLKRKPLQVPSTFLWRKSIEDLHVNSLLQWLRQNLLLVLQLLFVLFLIYATLGLRFHGASTEGKHYILLIDNSASMSAKDVKPSRLEWARGEALKVIDAAGDNDYGMIIAFNSKAATIQAYTNNRLKLREAVRGIEQTARVTRFEEALRLIDAQANPSRSTEDAAVRPEDVPAGEDRTYVPPKGIATTVHLFSDGRFPRVSEAFLKSLNAAAAGHTSALGNIHMIYHVTGKDTPGDANNVGIVSCNAIRTPLPGEKRDGWQAYVHVRNYRAQPAGDRSRPKVTLTLAMFVDGVQVDSQQKTLTLEWRRFKKGDPASKLDDEDEPGEILQIDGKEASQAVFTLEEFDARRNVHLHARLEKNDDDFPLDDEAWFVMSKPRTARVMIVGPPNNVLDSYFNAAARKEQAKVVRLTPADLTGDAYRKPARSGNVDLVIFDRCAPEDEADMPLANTFFIDRPPPPWRRGDKIKKAPLIFTSQANDPFLYRITSLWSDNIGVAEAFVFDVKDNLDERRKKLGDDVQRRLLPAQIHRILESDRKVPLLFTLPREPYTDLVMTFAILDEQGNLNTNWPHKRSFTLFVYNVVNNLGNVESAAHNVQTLSVSPGEPLLLRPEPEVKSLTFRTPGGAETVVPRGNRPEVVFTDTEKPGLYQARRDGALYRCLAVNLFDSESTLDPRGDLGLGQDNVEVRQSETNQPQELWKWILVIALVLLAAEWFFFNKRVSI